ncbi:hypothetical protein BASA81_018255 [Batrachochytrium salamandrivorans]|nr:hypothetical protein BASA81_018255 [Batrachochytrium salamandrivorans]
MQDEEEEIPSKRLHVGGASNLEKSVAKLTDNASALEEVAKTKVRNTMQTDPALERFDQLRIREVCALRNQTASAFLAEFQTTAASLEPDERIKLEVAYTRDDVELLKAVLADPQAARICALKWWYDGKEDVNSVVPLLINKCPELASLQVDFRHHSAFDFVSSTLEHPSNRIKVLDISPNTKGDSARFFAALGQSQVSVLTLSHSFKSVQGFYQYLAKDLLVRLEVRGRNQAPSELMMSLAKCTRLAQLKWMWCEFSHPIAFPKSVTKLELDNCTFADGFDWSFLAGSNVRELDLHEAEGVDGNQLGDALAVCLRAKGLDELRLVFVKATLAAVGVEVGRIKSLNVLYADLNDASIRLTALALQSPDSELRKLKLEYTNDTTSSIETRLVPASKHPNCNLAKLSLSTYGGAKVAEHFHKRLALFVLLQGRQVKRRYCPLRRLPVEMFRLVGMVLV